MTDRWTWHGGGLRAARDWFGDGAAPWIDLSTGINPHGWPVSANAFDWANLPDEQQLHALEAAAAAHFGVDPRYVCAVPGTEIGLRLMSGLITGPARHLVPSYRTHGEMLADSGPVTRQRLSDADGASLVIANPNNPDGIIADRAALLDMIARRGPGGWLLVDEAFADAAPDITIVGEVTEDRRLLVFRSFGKFFGLAGVRLGFVIGPPAFLSQLRRSLGAWPLSAAAIAIGTEAYLDRQWIEAMRHRLHAEAAALDQMMARAGFQAIGGCPLFRLIETGDARALFERLAHRAILTRPFVDNPGWLRLGLPKCPADFARLEQVLSGG